jgi:hypothetical protein
VELVLPRLEHCRDVGVVAVGLGTDAKAKGRLLLRDKDKKGISSNKFRG